MRQFRLAVYLVVGILLGANVILAHAAFSSASGGGFRPHPSGGAAYTGNGGTVSGGTAQTIESVNVGGKYVGVPYVGPLGAAALEAAIIALRSSPQTFAASVAIGYVANKGLQLIGEQWMSQGQSIPQDPVSTSAANYFWSTEAGVQNACSGSDPLGVVQCAAPTVTGWYIASQAPTSIAYVGNHPQYGEVGWTVMKTIACSGDLVLVGGQCNTRPAPCPSDYTLRDNACWPNNYVPATESDWDRVRGVTPPDAVWKDLCQQMAKIGSYCKVDSLTGQPVSTPISEYTAGPQAGQQTRQVAKVSPSPTTSDPLRVEVKIETETKTAATTNPETGETTPETEESKADENSDFCTVHPEALACAKLGDPEEAGPLEEKELGVSSITPTAFASNATCPADVTLPHGATFSFYWPCRFAVAVKPFLIALSWIVAGMLIIGVARDA